MTEAPNEIFELITKLHNNSNLETDVFTNLLVKLMMSGAKYPGFWSSEIIPPGNSESLEWVLIQRYCTLKQTIAWKQSRVHQDLLGEVSSTPLGNKLIISDEISQQGSSGGVVTVILTDVKSGMESAYWDWEMKMQMIQAKFPGYGGVYLQPPTSSKSKHWTKLLRFNSPETLETWFTSKERKKLLDESNKFVNAIRFQQQTSSFPGWFPSTEESSNHPSRWKTAMLVLLGLFPVIMLQRRFFYPHFVAFNPTLMIAFGTIMSVSLVTWVTNRVLIRTFNWWLLPQEVTRKKNTILGCLILACLFIAEITVLWNLLN